MSPPFDSAHVRRAFGRAAATYDANAILQHRVEEHLLDRLEFLETPPACVVDLGCGPGHAVLAMRKRWKSAQVIALDLAQPMLRLFRPGWLRPIVRVAADARALPFADASVDVLFSNLCIQWIDDLPSLFDEFRRVLKPGGYLTFSTFGPATLHELRSAWEQVDRLPHVSQFADIARVGDALMHAGFRDPVLDSEYFTLTYSDAPSVMRELKAIGATNADPRRARGLTGRQHYRQVAEAYETYREQGVLPATYEVIYAHAWSPDPSQPRRRGGQEIASFSIDRLRGSRR